MEETKTKNKIKNILIIVDEEEYQKAKVAKAHLSWREFLLQAVRKMEDGY